jgi:membrane-associated phospholipid phosphatase
LNSSPKWSIALAAIFASAVPRVAASEPIHLHTLDSPSVTVASAAAVGVTAIALSAFPHLLSRADYRNISDTGAITYLAVGVLDPLFQDGKSGGRHSLRIADALVVSGGITEFLKLTVRERRPASSSTDSFPSGHTDAAFCVAAMQSSFHPHQAALWYAGATFIAASRLSLRRHYVQDVLAGAVIGTLTARWELSRDRGLLITPWLKRGSEGIAFVVHF